MARNPSMRASDAERDRVAAALQEHCAQGRLSMEEFQERLEAAYVAKTVGDLHMLTADLPEEDLYELPVPARQSTGLAQRSRAEIDLALPGGIWPWLWGTWGVVSALACALWLLLWVVVPGIGPWDYAWWLPVSGAWGAIQLTAHLSDRRRHS